MNENTDIKEIYNGLYGIKTIAILGIILCHISGNGNYVSNNGFYEIIKKFGVFVELFMMLSSFGMCLGYYKAIKKQTLDFNTFYKKRYKKIIIPFALVVIFDLIMSGVNYSNISDSIWDLSLIYGFLPKSQIQIVGIAWTLGVIFAFYIIFPFFVFLIWDKKRAWITLGFYIILRKLENHHILIDGKRNVGNILSWMLCFFIGGILFLYKDRLIEIFKKRNYIIYALLSIVTGLGIVLYINKDTFGLEYLVYFIFVLMIILAITDQWNILGNRFFVNTGKCCLEIYLFHMMIYRLLEKTHVIKRVNGWLGFFIDTLLVVLVLLLVVFAEQYVLKKIKNHLKK